jgi:hypothetical protein
VSRLVDRVVNDRYGAEHLGDRYAKGWNHASEHIERAIREFEQRERMAAALRELAAAPSMDLRLKHALVNPSLLERNPTLAVSATPAAREVVGDLERQS